MLVERDVPAFGPPELCQLLLERIDAGLALAVPLGVRHQNSNAPHSLARLLRAHRERPRSRRAAEQRDQLAALHFRGHSMTSSAMATSLSGIWRPRALAVLRLITNANLMDCITGRSAGFSPLRIRPA